MPAASILIKPASSLCNIRCKYCFYRSLAQERDQESYGIMAHETLEALVKNALNYADGYCSFAFQGGEPTLAGLDFFREAVRLQKLYNTKHVEIQNTIQTNGIVINEEWAEFFAENHFLVGLSLDGNRKANCCRVDAKGNETFSTIMRTVRYFDKYHVEYNIVSVVNAFTAKHVRNSYLFFKEKGFLFQQYIACLDETPGTTSEYSLTPKAYGTFLNELFDLWYEDFTHGYNLDIRTFSNWVQMAAGYAPESCGMSGQCVCYFVVEGDGSVYPCDFYCTDEWKLGTVHDDFRQLIQSEKATRFVGCSRTVDAKCKTCQYFSLCRGGCRRWREPFLNGEPSLNCLCEAYEIFFHHCWDRIVRLGQWLRGQLEQKG